jgi:hypothetical protein
VAAAATVRAQLIGAGEADQTAGAGSGTASTSSGSAQLKAPGYSAADQLRDSGSVPWPSPPDSTGAIGASDYVETVNERIIDYDRSTLSPKWSMDLNGWVGGTAACNPQIKYEPARSRWFYVAIRCDFTGSANALYVGFSKTADPTNASSGWCKYELSTGAEMYDFPKLGLDGTRLMLGANQADLSSGQFGFNTGVIYVFHEPSGTITSCPSGLDGTQFGGPDSPLTTAQGHTAWSLEPATVADHLGSGYVVAADTPPYYGAGSNIMVWRVTGTSTPFTLTALGDAPVKPFSVPANIPQPGTEDTIQAYDGRLMMATAATDPAVGRETIWTVHTVDSGAGGTVVRWYELIPGSSPRVRQQGSISDRSGWAFNGAIAPTTNGGAVVNYDVGGPSRTVQIKAQSRIAGTRLGKMASPVTLATSSTADTDATCQANTATTPCRWGDYAGASLDPTNGSVVWGTNMFDGPVPATAQNWKAQWETENFALTPTDRPPTGAFTVSGASADLPVTFTASASDPDGTIASYSWNFGDGTTATGATTSHVYGIGGTYSVTLTITDNGGVTSSVTHDVTVS